MRQLIACVLLLALALHSAPAAAESPTPPLLVSTQTNFTFFVCGDNRGGDDIYTQILVQASSLQAAFLIDTGDLVRNGTDKDWRHFSQLMAGFTVPFFPVAGNHDVRVNGLKQFVRWTPTHTAHYSFDYGQLHFTMANDSLDMSTNELAWLDADLEASRQPVKIVVHHLPAWDPAGPVYGMDENQDDFLRLLRKHGVRYDLCGHDHGYRTGITNGTTLVVTGGAGARLYHRLKDGGFNHYVAFTVVGTNVTFKPVPITR